MKETKEVICQHFEVNPSGKLKQVINRAIRKSIPGGNETLDAIEWANGVRNTTVKHGNNPHLIDLVIDRFELIRDEMEKHVYNSAGL